MQTSNALGQRRLNLATLARAIWKNPGLSRRDLVERFDLDESTVSRLVGLLLSTGLVETRSGPEEPQTPILPSGGRPRSALRVRPDFGQAWGLTLWRDRVRACVVDTAGTALAGGELHLPPYEGDWTGYLDRALAFAGELALEGASELPLLGIGFGVPGWIDSESATIVQSDEFGIRDLSCPLLWNSELPVLWENDANCGAWNRVDLREGRADELFVLGRFLENGPLGLENELSIGFGFVIDGELHRGWRHRAGEFHSAFWRPGSRIAFGVDERIFAASRSDPAAFRRTVGELMANIAFAGQFLDPRRILLGGDLKTRFDEVMAACQDIGWAEAPKLLSPLPAELDEVSMGAALLVLEELFGPPAPPRRSFFRGYGTGNHDPLWRGIPLRDFLARNLGAPRA